MPPAGMDLSFCLSDGVWLDRSMRSISTWIVGADDCRWSGNSVLERANLQPIESSMASLLALVLKPPTTTGQHIASGWKVAHDTSAIVAILQVST